MAGVLVLVAVAFGALVLKRSAYSERRMTDAGVFFRAGYAVRAGLDPYAISDNGWYFLYPPGIAPAFVPLADPPSATSSPAPAEAPPTASGAFLPYPVSIVLWYIISVGALWFSIDLLARALMRGSSDPRVRELTSSSGGWWAARLWPLFLVLPDALSTLSRGQINTVVLAWLCLGTAWLCARKRFLGGLAIGAAACIKVIPGVLLFDLLLRRGGRAVAGAVVAAVLVMAVVPAVVYGPARAFDYTHEWVERVLLAGVLGSDDRLQAGSDFADTDNLSIQGALHNVTNISTPRGERPSQPAPWIKHVHVLASVAMLAATLLIGPGLGWRAGRGDTALQIVLRVGMLCCIMVLASPMSHRHYFVMILPALAALSFINTSRSPLAVPNGWGIPLIAVYILLQSIPRVQQQGLLRDIPLPVILTIGVWALCARELLRLASREAAKEKTPAIAGVSG